MPDWLLALPRLVWAPVRWVNRLLRGHFLSRHELVREGAAVVTPVIEFTRNLGPGSTMFGADEEIARDLRRKNERWDKLRPPLLTYGNHHPSDRVRELIDEAEIAVAIALNRTLVLFRTRSTATDMNAFHDSTRTHEDALKKLERLMAEMEDDNKLEAKVFCPSVPLVISAT